jgi:3-methyladenine DNA glycosylase AlkD
MTSLLQMLKKRSGKEPAGRIDLAERLLRGGRSFEEKRLALELAGSRARRMTPAEFRRCLVWIDLLLDEDLIDALCGRLSAHTVAHPQAKVSLMSLSRDLNPLKRRAALVLTREGARRGRGAQALSLLVADRLVSDRAGTVQEALAAILRQVSVSAPRSLVPFLLRHEDELPRGTLKRVLARLPAELRAPFREAAARKGSRSPRR